MLDRVKKKQDEGFKEFVQNMEVTTSSVRSQIFLNGILEDPLFMNYVLKNIRKIDDFFKLPFDEIDLVLSGHDSMPVMLARCLAGSDRDNFNFLQRPFPRWFDKFQEELSYLKIPSSTEKEAAEHFILKAVRKLQAAEKIQGFVWLLPPQDIFKSRIYPDGRSQILFDNGVLAAEGEMHKNQRLGFWRHYYETGKLLAEGEYREGLKSGAWVFYYSNGLHRAQGKYKADTMQGRWQQWDREGIMSEVEYENGVQKKLT